MCRAGGAQAMVNQAGTVLQLRSWSKIFGLEDRRGHTRGPDLVSLSSPDRDRLQQ